ncbi:MAG TPA: Gfo/Idh/MocA family oxidoreductase [Clostridia bacterium]|nr:Gfo/Idh/MocA family oxidoreductase [Clostridia bacterium]HRX42592.1 Gfo/Idh/MocA family oxidoreductase [Clostridia bacterium]
MKYLQIGCGSISGAWLSALSARSDVEICGLVDVNIDSAAKRAMEYKLDCPVYDNLERAIAEQRPDVAIDNVLPEFRLEVAGKCLSSGIHVLSEKPLSDSMKNAKEIIRLSDEYNREFFVMQNRRYNCAMLSFRDILKSGTVGNPGYLSAQFFRESHFGGFRELMDSPLLIDMAIHTFDQARYLLGKDPVSVYCKEYNTDYSWYKGNASATCIFTFEDNIIFNYSGSWSAPGTMDSYDSIWRAMCSKGTVTWNGLELPKAYITDPETDQRHPRHMETSIDYTDCLVSGHAGCINEMIESLEAGRRSSTDCRDNIKSLAMVFAAVRSAKENREVKIDEIMEVTI